MCCKILNDHWHEKSPGIFEAEGPDRLTGIKGYFMIGRCVCQESRGSWYGQSHRKRIPEKNQGISGRATAWI